MPSADENEEEACRKRLEIIHWRQERDGSESGKKGIDEEKDEKKTAEVMT